MNEVFFKYLVKIPEEYTGEVVGKLTILDVEVNDIDVNHGAWTLSTRSRVDIFDSFKQWLFDATKGLGSIERQ